MIVKSNLAVRAITDQVPAAYLSGVRLEPAGCRQPRCCVQPGSAVLRVLGLLDRECNAASCDSGKRGSVGCEENWGVIGICKPSSPEEERIGSEGAMIAPKGKPVGLENGLTDPEGKLAGSDGVLSSRLGSGAHLPREC